jgi:hypothetical protein
MWVKAKEREKNKEKHVNGAMFLTARSNQAQAILTYQAARNAIVNLAPNEEFGPWKKVLLELKDRDVRGPGPETATSNAHFVRSWIWTSAPQLSTSPDDPGLRDALRIEWCKSQERAKRHEEEVELVVEEMRRTLAMIKWNAHEWDTLTTSSSPSGSAIDTVTAAGITAYVYKQAAIQRKMVDVFFSDWYLALKDRSLGSSWLADYTVPPENKRHRLPSNVQLYHPDAYAPNAIDTPPDDLDPDFCDPRTDGVEYLLDDYPEAIV